MKKINDIEVFSLKEVCEVVGVKDYTIRYIEKNIPIKSFVENNVKWYTHDNISFIRKILELKDKGLDLKTIGMALESNIITFTEAAIASNANIENRPELIGVIESNISGTADSDILEIATSEQSNDDSDYIFVLLEKILENREGSLNYKETLKILMSSLGLNKKVTEIEKSIDTLKDFSSELIEQNKEVNNKLNKVLEKNNDILKSIEKGQESIEERDIQLVATLLSKMEEKKKSRRYRNRSFFQRMFNV